MRRRLRRSQRLSAGPERSCGLAISSKVKLSSASPSPTMRDAGRRRADVPPGADDDRRGILRIVEHGAPGDVERIAEAEIFERGLRDDGVDDRADDVDADQRHQVGQDLDEDDAPARLADHARRHDELAVAQRQRLRAGHARAPRPGGQRDDRHDGERPDRAGEGGKQDQQRNVGYDQHRVGEEIERGIECGRRNSRRQGRSPCRAR